MNRINRLNIVTQDKSMAEAGWKNEANR